MFLLKKRYWLTLTIVLTAFLVLRSVPATWFIHGIQQAAPGLQVATVEGSLWQGSVDAAQWLDRGKVLPLGELKWQLNGLSLLTLNPCFDFSTMAPRQQIKGSACYSLLGAKIAAKDLDIKLPIKNIAPFFNVDLDGAVEASIGRAIWSNQGFKQLDFTMLWQRAALYSGSQWLALGDIQGEGQQDANGGVSSQWLSVESTQRSAPLVLDLDVALANLAAAKPAIRVNGTATPGPNASRGLSQILQFIGEPVDGGSYRIDISE